MEITEVVEAVEENVCVGIAEEACFCSLPGTAGKQCPSGHSCEVSARDNPNSGVTSFDNIGCKATQTDFAKTVFLKTHPDDL